jgi:alpha-L-fucosidase
MENMNININRRRIPFQQAARNCERVLKQPQWALAGLLVVLAAAGKAEETQFQFDLPITKGPFEPTMESLLKYETPDWFRDAKFGIWAHWGPSSVLGTGNWIAREMYQEGSRPYQLFQDKLGHQSEYGYKDLIPLWKAEKWEPDRLMALYKKAGAKYFVSMGAFHDNFYMWETKLPHRWNAVNMGPKRDIVGEWQKAARKAGLKFGISDHLGPSYTWFQTSHGADTNGPKAGVPYDGADPKWQDLYHPANPEDHGMGWAGITWYSDKPAWAQEWYNAMKEVMDKYQPDLFYTDGPIPWDKVGLSAMANFYNVKAEPSGKTQGVYALKGECKGSHVQDMERGILAEITPYPWQIDTCASGGGDWFYNSFREHYRSATWVSQMLVDVVSKNGNLLLNIVQRPDGTILPEEEEMLHQIADWIAVQGEAIYGTRPWTRYGEGPVRARSGAFNEDYEYTAKDVRFTTKGKLLYAIALGWPGDGKLQVKSLAEPAGKITRVTLLGHDGILDWKQTADGLLVTLPAKQISPYTVALKITGDGMLEPAAIPAEVIRAGADGK